MKKLLFVIIVLLCTSCNKTKNTTDTSKYDYPKDVTIKWDDIFSLESDNYLVYFYSLTCSHCRDLKQEILTFYYERQPLMYFVNTNDKGVFGKTKDLRGIDSVDDFYIFGTPFLIRIKEYKVSDYYPGVTSIREYIHSYSI